MTIQAIVQDLLTKPLPTTTSGLKTSLRALEIVRSDLLQARVASQTTLATKREQCRVPKDKDLTDFDRKIMSEALVSSYQSDYELLKGLEELAQERMHVYQLLLQQGSQDKG